MSVDRFCPFKMAGSYGYPTCEFSKCMWYVEGQCSVTIQAKNTNNLNEIILDSISAITKRYGTKEDKQNEAV